jgi:hypothetical protein
VSLARVREGSPAPHLALDGVAADTMCVTKGKVAQARVAVPTFRAVAPGRSGDAAAMKFIVHGSSTESRALASGEERRQLGLKLRADNGCNLVYVMWRLDPKPKLVVSVKSNPGERTAKECGAGGYTNVKPAHTGPLPALDDGAEHELRAEIDDDTLTAWADGAVVWQGTLPASAAQLSGPAGVRSDNLDFEVTTFAADARAGGNVAVKCETETSD